MPTKTPTAPKARLAPKRLWLEAAAPPVGASPLTLTGTAEITAIAAGAGGADAERALPRFKMLAYTGGAMRVAGWRHPVVLDLAGLAVPSQNRPIRFAHDPAAGVGHTDAIKVEGGQLVATGVISRDTATAREVVASSRNGFPWQASVGASVEEFEFIRESQKAIVNGQEFAGPINVVRKATLGEISFVDLGADGRTSASIAAQQGGGGSGSPAGGDADPAHGAGAAALRAEALAETSRIAAVRKICAGKHLDIEAQAIRDGWDATRTELEVLRASRPKAPAIHTPDMSITSEVLEAACFQSAKLEGLDKVCSAQALEVAAKRFQSGLGLQELLIEAAIANGYTGRTFRDSRRVLEAAFGRGIEAGMTIIDVGGILSNVANKFLLEGFFSVERVWRSICAVRNVSDFKTVTSYRLVGKDQYEQVAPGGELKHGTLGEETYSNKADTYGLMLAIDRRDIINDDLGAITTVPRKLGRGSGLKINDVFWTAFMNNAAFFAVGNKNFISGADTALGIDGLTKGEVTFMDLVDSDGKPTGVMPSILLVPTALSAVGTQLYKSVEMRDTTANTKFPVANPHQGKFRIEVSRYLSNALYTGNSPKAWYLLADPSDLPVIEMAFLNGQEAPPPHTIETSDADFSQLGGGIATMSPRSDGPFRVLWRCMDAMQITPQIAVYVLLLVPGLLGHALFCAFTYTAKPTWSGRTVVAILLSAISYASLALLRTWDKLSWLPDPVALLNAAEKGIPATVSANSLLCVLGACVLSAVFALMIVAGHNHRTMFRIAQKVGLTTKSGFESEWDGCMMLRARTRWVMVLMKDGSAFTGWVESHDIASTDRGLVLSKVREYDKEGNNFQWPADELLYMNSLADVRALRLIPNKEPCNEQANTAEAGAAAAQDRDTIREYKPESSPEGAAARLTDEAVTIAGENGVLTTPDTNKEAANG